MWIYNILNYIQRNCSFTFTLISKERKSKIPKNFAIEKKKWKDWIFFFSYKLFKYKHEPFKFKVFTIEKEHKITKFEASF